ncbi:MAG: PUR family DNA/RNA-binding protein [Bacteroidota bacterium]|nr:MAG: PUR family DNA/RNA-binding protein [Bacteroidota bacterium]
MAEDKDFVLPESDSERDEVFSKSVRAGKRTYFFDVKATRRNEYYITVTESKKRFHDDGRFYFEKHKIFLYKEDFEKFKDGLDEVLQFIQNAGYNSLSEHEAINELQPDVNQDYLNINFEDLELEVSAEQKTAE